MNNPNIKVRVRLEIEKSEESFKAAKLLLDTGLYDEAISSAYYAMFHMAKSVLLSVNEEPSTHHGLITLYGLHFIKPKLMEELYNDMLIDAKESREASDYDAARKFTKEEASEKVDNAMKFNQRISKYLKEQGYI